MDRKATQYQELSRILDDAHAQAATGKGNERHANNEPFEQQKILVISRWLEGNPCAGPLFQAVKKAVETTRLSPKSAIRELYGTIVYSCAAIKHYEEIIAREEAKEDEAVKQTGVFEEDEADVVRRRLREIQAHTPM